MKNVLFGIIYATLNITSLYGEESKIRRSKYGSEVSRILELELLVEAKKVTVARREDNWFSTSNNDLSSVTLRCFHHTTQEIEQGKLLVLNATEF